MATPESQNFHSCKFVLIQIIWLLLQGWISWSPSPWLYPERLHTLDRWRWSSWTRPPSFPLSSSEPGKWKLKVKKLKHWIWKVKVIDEGDQAFLCQVQNLKSKSLKKVKENKLNIEIKSDRWRWSSWTRPPSFPLSSSEPEKWKFEKVKVNKLRLKIKSDRWRWSSWTRPLSFPLSSSDPERWKLKIKKWKHWIWKVKVVDEGSSFPLSSSDPGKWKLNKVKVTTLSS